MKKNSNYSFTYRKSLKETRRSYLFKGSFAGLIQGSGLINKNTDRVHRGISGKDTRRNDVIVHYRATKRWGA